MDNRRLVSILSICLLFIIMACRAVIPAPLPSPTPSPYPSLTYLPPTATLPPTPTLLIPTVTVEQVLTPTFSVPAISPSFTIYMHPENALYVGDLVSLEVIAPQGMELEESDLTVQVDQPAGPILGTTQFSQWGIAGRDQATLLWVWDTHATAAGKHTLSFSIQPEQITWNQDITLLPASTLPKAEAEARWERLQTECCTVNYITNTAAERDIEDLAEVIDLQAELAKSAIEVGFSEPITITILPRLLGHGGFANDEIHVSYLDRNYAGNSWDMVVLHEMIHILDARQGGELRPSIFVEGLAVYLSGGHYKSEPLMPRAAALLNEKLDAYVPLPQLADDFYSSQHEAGYLEAGALVEYMIGRWGWETFNNFYRQIQPSPSGQHSEAINAALQEHFNLTINQLDKDFKESILLQPGIDHWADELYLTVNYYDTLRRYQEALDPSAYFRTAWLVDSKTMRDKGIIADYFRHPNAPENLALETLLISAGEDLTDSRYIQAGQKLTEINAVLEAIENNSPQAFASNPLAYDYLTIVHFALDAGYQDILNIHLTGRHALVMVSKELSGISELLLTREGNSWRVYETGQ